MRLLLTSLIVSLAFALSGCGKESPETTAVNKPVTPDPESKVVSPADGVLSGEQLFLACIACHSLQEGQAHRVGPNLFGIAGQSAASRPGYTYSEALQNSEIIWNQGTLMGWIMQTEAMVPATWMAYSNYLDAAEVQRLADYILGNSEKGK